MDDSSLHSSSFPSSVSAVQSSAVPSSSVPAAQVSLGGPQACLMGSATVSAPSGLGPVSSLVMGLNNASMGAPAVASATLSVSTTGSSIPSASSSIRSSAASSGKAHYYILYLSLKNACSDAVITILPFLNWDVFQHFRFYFPSHCLLGFFYSLSLYTNTRWRPKK